MRHSTIKVLFFIMLLAPFVVSYFTLQLRKDQIKKEVKHMLMTSTPKHQLYTLNFSKKEAKIKLRWEKDHEFEFQGKMYDIVEEQESRDSVTFICWLDKEETELNKKLHQLTHFNFLKDVEKNNCDGALVYLIENQFLPPNSAQNVYHIKRQEKQNYFYSNHIQTRYLSLVSPPPEFMFTQF